MLHKALGLARITRTPHMTHYMPISLNRMGLPMNIGRFNLFSGIKGVKGGNPPNTDYPTHPFWTFLKNDAKDSFISHTRGLLLTRNERVVSVPSAERKKNVIITYTHTPSDGATPNSQPTTTRSISSNWKAHVLIYIKATCSNADTFASVPREYFQVKWLLE